MIDPTEGAVLAAPTTHFAATSDLPSWAIDVTCILTAISFALLLFEMRRRERGGISIALTGALAVVALLAAILRPVRISARESVVGPRVVILSDVSRSMALPSDSTRSRREDCDIAIASVRKHAASARILVLGFGDGVPRPISSGESPEATTDAPRSDLAFALRSIANSAEEHPAAVVVVSDGRLDDPTEGATPISLRALEDEVRAPIHTIATTHQAPADASVRRVASAGAAVAHVPLPLRVEVGCDGGVTCDELTVTARELREDGPPALLANGLVHVKDGKGAVDLTVTLERAGTRIIEVGITPPAGDRISENDRRFVTLNVARERVRVLHVAGRPTNDVRALRQWLKSDASVDVVAFFILRTPADNPQASQDDLALIPFPVDELFTDHLPSFDAVVLQDFDAQPYGLERHLGALARYVRTGGGLIMVGGANSFVAGGYAGTQLGNVLPVTLDGSPGATAADTAPFVPVWSEQGHAAPLLSPLRALLGDELPVMPGANVLGEVRGGGTVLWTHPTRKGKDAAAMPVLAIGEQGDGRSIALGVDGGWLLQFSALGARNGGRAHGALWDGLLGWLMRDPRFEPAHLELPRACTAGVPTILQIHSSREEVEGASRLLLDVTRLDKKVEPLHMEAPAGTRELVIPALEAGGYAARLRFGSGLATRRDFACEVGADEWADSRPDPDRLRELAKSAYGNFAWADEDASIPLPKATVVSAERHVVPVAPPWMWTLCAALVLGGHWLVRRRAGLV